MKFIFTIVLSAVVLTVACADKREKLRKFIGDVNKAYYECMADPATKMEPESIDRLRASTATDEDRLAQDKHEFCKNVKMGVQKPNGDYEIDVIRKRLDEGGIEQTNIDLVVDTCGTRPAGSTAEKAGGVLSQCIFDNVHKGKSLKNVLRL